VRLLLCALLAFFSPSLLAQQGSESTSGKPAVIKGSGCVTEAVETKCLMLKDSKTEQMYNLLFTDHPPASGMAIRFKGTEHQGMTTCMQGKPVNVASWKRVKGTNCPAVPADGAH